MSAYYVPSTILHSGNATVNDRVKIPRLMELIFQREIKQTNNQINTSTRR